MDIHTGFDSNLLYFEIFVSFVYLHERFSVRFDFYLNLLHLRMFVLREYLPDGTLVHVGFESIVPTTVRLVGLLLSQVFRSHSF